MIVTLNILVCIRKTTLGIHMIMYVYNFFVHKFKERKRVKERERFW